RFGLEFFGGGGDAKKVAREHRVSLETAARELRYGFLATLILDKIATAHTLDDQAETVLMKMLRGAGTRGLSGIWPVRQYSVPSTQKNTNSSTQYPVLSTQKKSVQIGMLRLYVWICCSTSLWRCGGGSRGRRLNRRAVRRWILSILMH